MNNDQIISKAINKAIEGDWDIFGHLHTMKGDDKIIARDPIVELWHVRDKAAYHHWHVRDMLLNNYFLRAFFGTEPLFDEDGKPTKHPDAQTSISEEWEYHKNKIEVAPDPLKYIEEYLQWSFT